MHARPSDFARFARQAVRATRLLVPTLTAAVLLHGCRSPLGRFEYVTLRSASERAALRYGVYLPRRWDRTTPLPLVVLLHGAGDDASSADRSEVVEQLDVAIASGQLPPFILVTPEGQLGFWSNWHDGSHHYRDWVVREVIPDAYRRFALLPAPQGLHLLGVSMGAGGGLQLWLHTPNLFASAALLSAPILDEQGTRAFLRHFMPREAIERVFGPAGRSSGIDPYAVLRSDGDLHGTRLLFGAASDDKPGILASNHAFHEALERRHVAHTLVTFPGTHGWRAWGQAFPYVLCRQLAASCQLPQPPGMHVSSRWTKTTHELGTTSLLGD